MASNSDWRIEIDNTVQASWPPPYDRSHTVSWDLQQVLGPFPIHAREQQLISPSFPLDLSEPIDWSKSWPSSYADNAFVNWSSTTIDQDGNISLVFPGVRWPNLRSTEGWAALQHHAILRATLTLYPPATVSAAPKLSMKVQASRFALLPLKPGSHFTPQWHAADIYAMHNVLPRYVSLPSPPSLTEPTQYHLFVSGDYEIRLFGDPTNYDCSYPIQSLNIKANIALDTPDIVHESSQDVICDFVGGFAFGSAIGIGMRNNTQCSLAVTSAHVTGPNIRNITVSLLKPMDLVSNQMRVIALEISQTAAFSGEVLELLILMSTGQQALLKIPIKHRSLWSPSDSNYYPVKASYFFAGSMPSAFLALPPWQSEQPSLPPILALHGAGVEIFDDDASFWANAIPRQGQRWIILPTGRTSWGLDWHGPSAQDALDSVDALATILHSAPYFAQSAFAIQTPLILLGHSNGGQGAWYLASRFPDRVLAVVAASAYIKSQSYVPWTMSRSAHFIDPALHCILETSLTPDNNDLFLSNLVDTPVLAIHGAVDSNVPTWHSREAVSILKAWRSNANVLMREVEGQNHWFDSVFDNQQVQEFLDSVPMTRPYIESGASFTLTVSLPHESGSMHGWSIESLARTGRLGRITVKLLDGVLTVQTSNVQVMSMRPALCKADALVIDGKPVSRSSSDELQRFVKSGNGDWEVTVDNSPSLVSPCGRMQSILKTRGSFTIVIPDHPTEYDFSVATRLTYDLDAYHKLDANIVHSHQALSMLREDTLGPANIIAIDYSTSSGQTSFVREILNMNRTAYCLDGPNLKLRDIVLDAPGLGTLLLHPHPVREDGLLLIMLANDDAGMERVLGLFPIRTGIPVPDFVVVSEKVDSIGTAGILSAGVWGSGWRWNETASWI